MSPTQLIDSANSIQYGLIARRSMAHRHAPKTYSTPKASEAENARTFDRSASRSAKDIATSGTKPNRGRIERGKDIQAETRPTAGPGPRSPPKDLQTRGNRLLPSARQSAQTAIAAPRISRTRRKE